MRKTLLLLFSVVITLSLATACQDDKGEPDPYDVPAEPGGESALTFLRLAGQLSDATITHDDEKEDVGEVSVLLDIDLIELSSVEVLLLDIPDMAVASINKGDRLDFTGEAPQIVVTAQNSSQRTYTVHYTIPSQYYLTAPTDFRLLGQQGDAVIRDDELDDSKGYIEVAFSSRQIDFAAIEVTGFELPYGAASSIGEGSVIDLSDLNGEFSFEVTALSGHVREYTVRYTLPPASDENYLLDIGFAGQLGFWIANDPSGASKGSVTVSFPLGTDLANITVTGIEVSEYATAGVTAGGFMNLSQPNIFTVTAESGLERNYTVTAGFLAATDEITGTYSMSRREVLGGEYSPVIMEGGIKDFSVFMNVMDKNWSWQGGRDNLQKMDDYIVTFNQSSADHDYSYGSVKVTAGSGGYTDFIWGDGTDVNDMYRVVPYGTNKWRKELATGVISFFDTDDNLLGQCDRLEPGTDLSPDNIEGAAHFIVGNGEYAFQREFYKESWYNGDDHWNDAARFVHNCRRVLWIVTKTN